MPDFWSWALFNSWVVWRAIIFSGTNDLFTSIKTFWTNAFLAFQDTFNYYLFWQALNLEVVAKGLWLLLMIVWVAFVCSVVFINKPWFRSSYWLSKAPKNNLT